MGDESWLLGSDWDLTPEELELAAGPARRSAASGPPAGGVLQLVHLSHQLHSLQKQHWDEQSALQQALCIREGEVSILRQRMDGLEREKADLVAVQDARAARMEKEAREKKAEYQSRIEGLESQLEFWKHETRGDGKRPRVDSGARQFPTEREFAADRRRARVEACVATDAGIRSRLSRSEQLAVGCAFADKIMACDPFVDEIEEEIIGRFRQMLLLDGASSSSILATARRERQLQACRYVVLVASLYPPETGLESAVADLLAHEKVSWTLLAACIGFFKNTSSVPEAFLASGYPARIVHACLVMPIDDLHMPLVAHRQTVLIDLLAVLSRARDGALLARTLTRTAGSPARKSVLDMLTSCLLAEGCDTWTREAIVSFLQSIETQLPPTTLYPPALIQALTERVAENRASLPERELVQSWNDRSFIPSSGPAFLFNVLVLAARGDS